MQHISKWLTKIDERKCKAGNKIEVWELNHDQDKKILSAWARHFRQHYCSDDLLDELRRGTPYSRKEFLEQIIFPDKSIAPGPSIRSGDFAELLVADFLEFSQKYWVPRTRMDNKASRNESVKGCDVIAFKMIRSEKPSAKDELVIFETKAQLSQPASTNRLQNAIDDSAKDEFRKATALNATKRRLIELKDPNASKVERFQNPIENPYTEINGAAAVMSTVALQGFDFNAVDSSDHPNQKNLRLLVIRGNELMQLVQSIFERAANEA